MVGETKPEHPLHPRRPFNRRQLLMQAVVAVVILASGIGIGAGGTILTLRDRIVWHIPSPSPDRDRQPGPRPGGDIVKMLKVQYNLSDEQEEKVKTLFAARLEQARARWKELNTAEQAEREKLIEDMKPILTPEQFEKWSLDYRKMLDDMGNRPFWGPRGDRRGPPHGDRGPGLEGRRGGRSRERFGDPNGPRMDGAPRSLKDFEGRRGNWPPRGPMDPNGHRKDRPAEVSSRPGEVNVPK
jgi:hypothetical protein